MHNPKENLTCLKFNNISNRKIYNRNNIYRKSIELMSHVNPRAIEISLK